MHKRKMDEMISHFNCKVANMDIDQKYKMELLGMITAIGIANAKESAQPEQKTGKWIPVTYRYVTNENEFPKIRIVWQDATEPDDIAGIKCSECGTIYDFTEARNWCSECGAYMRGEDNV